MTLKAVTIVKAPGTLQYLAFELSIEDGKIVDLVQLSRAPDLPGIVIPGTYDKLWEMREQDVDHIAFKAKST